MNKFSYMVVNRDQINTAYQDLTGRFPICLSRGNQYVMIEYLYDANCILSHPVRDLTANSLTNSLEYLHQKFKNQAVLWKSGYSTMKF